ncbi:MAG: nucleotidyltransferase family protein [Gemmatimonadota bacterium]|nr:nucleotidyltransferase family protein [Gemmatimonadota bacterium]
MIATPTLESLRARRDEILRLAEKYGVYDIRVFGSLLHGDATAESDVDLLIKMEERRSLFDHIGFMQDLEELLGRKVDVVHDTTLHWLIREEVLEEAVPL